MFEKVFGREKSLHREIVKAFVISIVIIIALTLAEFFIFVEPSVIDEMGDIRLVDQDMIYIARRSLGFAIANIIIVSVIIIRINMKKLLQPINKINEATKRVTDGDYDVVIETKRRDEIGELINNFNKMTKGLQSTENLQKEFINNVSHEIKTPISSIEGYAKLLKDKKLSDEEREEYSNIIIEESERLSNLTGKMLKLSKLHNQDRIVNKQEILVAEQIRKTVSILEPQWSRKNLKINVKLEEKIFFGDEDLVFQIWMNLIENAIKFSNDNGKIEIKLYEENDKIYVTIKDNGIGIAEDELERIFERFYQIDKSHSENGSGLGLAIVKRIIELSEGEIKIESKEGKGTTVIVELPIDKKENKVYVE